MKKLAILINSMNGGGAEHVVSILLDELVKKYEVYLVVLHPGIAYKIPSEVKLYNLGHSSVNASDYSKVIHLLLLSYKYYRYCKKNKINISLSLLNRSNYINIISKLFITNRRTIISERISTLEIYPENTLKGKFSRLLVKWLYPKADSIISISKGIAKDLENSFKIQPEKNWIIYNPIDLASISEDLLKLNAIAKNKEFTFIAIGRLYKQKNYQLLLHAFAKLNYPSKLIILGDGPLRREINETIIKLNIENKVLMPGFVKNIFAYLKNADCFVISSDFEGFGNVIIEALACGKAVISTDCKHGPSEILAEKINPVVRTINKFELVKYGILVPKNNPYVLSEAMKEMIFNEKQRKIYELQGPERAKHFEKNFILSQYLNVFEGN